MNKKIILTILSITAFGISSINLFGMKNEKKAQRAKRAPKIPSIFEVIHDETKTESEKIVTINRLITREELDINANDYGSTPLMNAVYGNYERIVALLLEKGADANIGFSQGEKPLHIACRNGNLEIVKLLLPHCTNRTISVPSRKDPDLGTPLDIILYRLSMLSHYAKEFSKEKYPEYLEIVKLLLKSGAKIDRRSLAIAKAMTERMPKKSPEDTISINLLNYLELAKDYDSSPNRNQFIKDIINRDNKKFVNLEDAYDLVHERSYIIEPQVDIKKSYEKKN